MVPSQPPFIRSHLDKKDTYVEMLLIDFSSALNIILPQHKGWDCWAWTPHSAPGSCTSLWGDLSQLGLGATTPARPRWETPSKRVKRQRAWRMSISKIKGQGLVWSIICDFASKIIEKVVIVAIWRGLNTWRDRNQSDNIPDHIEQNDTQFSGLPETLRSMTTASKIMNMVFHKRKCTLSVSS